MATYEYLTTGEAMTRASEGAREFERIIGLRGMDAGRIRPALTRTAAGNMRKPSDSWRAHGQREEFREIAGVIRTRDDGSGVDADPGTITVTFADRTSTYLHAGDLLCVERPVIPEFQKCAGCHLFIELSDDAREDSALAPYVHLDRGDAADERVTGTHDAWPSGRLGTLDWWRENGPADMVARFD
jgi:hypothetical protein